MSLEQLFFELLQVAIGTRKSLSRTPSADEWRELFALSKKQALTAIAFTGVTRLNEASDFGASLGIPEAVYLKWLGLTAKVAQRNREVSAACVELVKQYAHDGMVCCVLKGQGNQEYYKTPSSSPCLGGEMDAYDIGLCRTPGDIDIWVKPMDESGIDIAVADLDGRGAHYERYTGKRAVIEYVKMLHRIAGSEPHEGVRYHHIDAPSVNGVDVEAHFRPLFLDSPLRNWRLQRWFRLNEQFGLHDAKIGDVVLPVPTTSFNAVYQLCHIYRHLFDEGIGLRQLLDYYFVLRALHIEQGSLADRTESMAQWAEGMGIAVKSNEEIMHTLGRFGMRKFAGAVMYVLAQVFDPREDIKTKTIKTPEAVSDSASLAANVSSDEYSNTFGTSSKETSSGVASNTDSASGDKPEKQFFEDVWQKRWPWMICEPNEKEGKFLLNEIMLAGNFGKYDTRISHSTSQIGHAWEKLKHNFRLIRHYPEEVLCEPFFRIYHYLWRKLELWRF